LIDVELPDGSVFGQFTQVRHQVAESKGRVRILGVQRGQQDAMRSARGRQGRGRRRESGRRVDGASKQEEQEEAIL
jgi:hypothetical protein